MSEGDFNLQHFFQTHRLRAKLQIGCGAMPNAGLVLDRLDIVAYDLDCIGATGQSQFLRP